MLFLAAVHAAFIIADQSWPLARFLGCSAAALILVCFVQQRTAHPNASIAYRKELPSLPLPAATWQKVMEASWLLRNFPCFVQIPRERAHVTIPGPGETRGDHIG